MSPLPESRTRPAVLEDVLAARERRARRQKDLLACCGGAVVSFTPVAPGAEKSAPRFRAVHAAGRDAILGALRGAGIDVRREETRSGPAGFESLFAVQENPLRIKKIMAAVEENHPAGRLFDIDVIGADGLPLGRGAIGLPPRTCLLCGNPAGDCARSRAHPLEDVIRRIDELMAAVGEKGGGAGDT